MDRSLASLDGKTAIVTGSAGGIGKGIALGLAAFGANLVIADKDGDTAKATASEIEAMGVQALPLTTDVREFDQVKAMTQATLDRFGGVDILVNNASAIHLAGTLETPMKRYDLMQSINTRGAFLTSRLCLPYLLKAENPHILNLSPPLNLEPQ